MSVGNDVIDTSLPRSMDLGKNDEKRRDRGQAAIEDMQTLPHIEDTPVGTTVPCIGSMIYMFGPENSGYVLLYVPCAMV